ncbi:MAG: hypothetical protein ACLTSX_06705 [Collinsella sp.]
MRLRKPAGVATWATALTVVRFLPRLSMWEAWSLQDDPGVVGEALAFFSSIDYRPFWVVSSGTSGLALAISLCVGVVRRMASCEHVQVVSSGVLDSAVHHSHGAAPTGPRLLLLMLFMGKSTAVGRWLASATASRSSCLRGRRRSFRPSW